MVFGFLSRNKLVPEDPSQTEEGETQSLPTVPPKSPSPTPEVKDEGPSNTQGPRDIQSFYKLIKSMPPKALHEYTMTRLRSQEDEPDLGGVLSFFSELQPPPLLHCVRCHKNYFEIENTERSCQIEHDDDSAEVEKFGGNYETTYSCCGRTVEGEGDMGPPDGWCYEGEHTADRIRARYRADSTVRSPMLVPCTRSCHPVPASALGSRKRRRVKESDTEDDQDEEDDSGVEEITRPRSSPNKDKEKAPKLASTSRKRAPKKVKTVGGEDSEANDATGAESAPPSSPEKKVTSRKPRKPRTSLKKQEPVENTDIDSDHKPTKKPQSTRSSAKGEVPESETEKKPTKTARTPRAKDKAKSPRTESPQRPKTPTTITKSSTKSTTTSKPRSTRGKSLREVVSTSVDGEV